MNHVFEHNGVIRGEAACLYIIGQASRIQNMLCTFRSRKQCKQFLTSVIKGSLSKEFHISFNHIDRQWDLIIDDVHYTVCTHNHTPPATFDIDQITLESTTMVRFGESPIDFCAPLLNLMQYKYNMLSTQDKTMDADAIFQCVVKTQYMHDRGWKIQDRPYNLRSTWRIAEWSPNLEKLSYPDHTTCPICGSGFRNNDLIVHFCLTHLNIHSKCFIRMFL
jgi:hypothetical protein